VNGWRIAEPSLDDSLSTLNIASNNTQNTSKGKKGKNKGASKSHTSQQARPEFEARIESLFSIEHGKKVEFILCKKECNSTDFSRFFVADTTRNITVYNVQG
jgi:hypothetical protein